MKICLSGNDFDIQRYEELTIQMTFKSYEDLSFCKWFDIQGYEELTIQMVFKSMLWRFVFLFMILPFNVMKESEDYAI